MLKDDTEPSGGAGWAELAIDDLDVAGKCGPCVPVKEEVEDLPKVGWMKALDKVADLCLIGSMYVLYPAILVVICTDVIGRNFFGTPLSWAIEGSGLFLIGGIFLAVSRVELDNDHILLDILYANYSKKKKLICDMVTRSIAFLWMLAATIRSSFEIPTSIVLKESGTDFRYPFWPMRVIMTFGFLVLTLALLANAVHAYQQLRNGGRK
ncbi:TRAP transporter small permease [Solidesulfovibrio sp.]|uniref:TRAP transporter small permease subunit n=1 Tax=Solidesulfovibrio sp. TaxID=2910990 RepID=UPI00260909A1|nr:TRAP transporter small permease [Solidesulfovibrio sp.]